MRNEQAHEAPDFRQQGNGLEALVRVGWMALGTIGIITLAMLIASQPSWSFGVRDVLFWSLTLLTALLRYVDVAKLGGRTAQGDPATPTDFRRYLVVLAGCATLLWVGAQSIHL